MDKMFPLRAGRLPYSTVQHVIFIVRPKLALMDIVAENVHKWVLIYQVVTKYNSKQYISDFVERNTFCLKMDCLDENKGIVYFASFYTKPAIQLLIISYCIECPLDVFHNTVQLQVLCYILCKILIIRYVNV